jgi:hypothetical protein
MSSKRADGDAWQTEHPRRRQLPSRRLERERQEALERRAVIESQRQLQWEDDEDDDNRTYITQDEVIELLRDMERYRQKIAAAASLFEGWLATITAAGRVRPAMPSDESPRPASGRSLVARDQARRLSRHRPQERRAVGGQRHRRCSRPRSLKRMGERKRHPVHGRLPSLSPARRLSTPIQQRRSRGARRLRSI